MNEEGKTRQDPKDELWNQVNMRPRKVRLKPTTTFEAETGADLMNRRNEQNAHFFAIALLTRPFQAWVRSDPRVITKGVKVTKLDPQNGFLILTIKIKNKISTDLELL